MGTGGGGCRKRLGGAVGVSRGGKRFLCFSERAVSRVTPYLSFFSPPSDPSTNRLDAENMRSVGFARFAWLDHTETAANKPRDFLWFHLNRHYGSDIFLLLFFLFLFRRNQRNGLVFFFYSSDNTTRWTIFSPSDGPSKDSLYSSKIGWTAD